MHRITVSLDGVVTISESREVADGEALPLFVKLKSALQAEDSPVRRKRGRPAQEGSDPQVSGEPRDAGSST